MVGVTMARHIGLVVGLVIFALARPTSAQTPGRASNKIQVSEVAPSLGATLLSLREGLPNTNVRAIAQDARGFMWLGTQDGLARYDGISAHIYRTSETDMTSVSSGYITALTLDASGKLWVGTSEHGVNLYDPVTDKFTRFVRGAQGLSSDGVSAIARDAKDRIWFAMSEGGLDRYANGKITAYLVKPLNVVITCIDVDSAGNLWLGTADGRVIRWNPDDNSSATFTTATGSHVTAIKVTTGGRVLVGTDGAGLVELDPRDGRVIVRHDASSPASLSDNHVSVIFEDKRRSVWVGTSNGLNRMDGRGGFVHFVHDTEDPSSFPSPGVESIYQDRGGVMWVGTFADGVAKFDESRMNLGYHHTRTHSLSFFEDRDGTLWVGTYNDGLNKYDPGLRRMTKYLALANGASSPGKSVALDAGWIMAIRRDSAGLLWLAVKGHGLIAFDTKNDTYRHYLPDADDPNSLPVDTVFDIWEDHDRALWLATWGGGVVRFDRNAGTFTSFTSESDGLPSDHLYKLYPDPTDKQILWLGTAKGGLVRFHIKTHTLTAFRHSNETAATISSDDVTAIYREATGAVWLGTFGGGLNRLDPATGRAEHFTTANSALTNNTVFGVLPDTSGKLWISTNGGGLLQLDPKTREFVVYSVSNGLQDNEFAQGSAMLGRNGQLFFGGREGFNSFFPKNITRNAFVPPIVMTALKVFNHDVRLDRPIWTLPPIEVSYSDSFEVNFAALSYAAPEKNRYAYKLEGFDDQFIQTNRPSATYTKLDGGQYTLRVRAANEDGVWNDTGIALRITVAPPIWRTRAAYAVYILVLGLLAYLVVRYQRQRLLRSARDGRLAVVERDLALTGAVQSGFLPDHNEITTTRIQVVGMYRPAEACGGDWWWHEVLPDGRHLVMVGDVTGHGPGAAMVTAAVATTFRVLLEQGVSDMERMLALLNREVLRVGKGNYHMSMAALEINAETGHWILHNAAAPPILSLTTHGKHRVHFCPGSPLGSDVFETGRAEGVLQNQERLFICTDGIPEVAWPDGKMFGMRRLAQQFEKTRTGPLRDAARSLVMQADQIRGNQVQSDDWTFAMIEWI
jgi:ligand-binding sensor domain-containing protein